MLVFDPEGPKAREGGPCFMEAVHKGRDNSALLTFLTRTKCLTKEFWLTV